MSARFSVFSDTGVRRGVYVLSAGFFGIFSAFQTAQVRGCAAK